MKKEKDKNLLTGTAIGSLGLGGGAVVKDYTIEYNKYKNIKKVNQKKIDAFISELKAGDVILESDPKSIYSGQAIGVDRAGVLRKAMEKRFGVKYGKTITDSISKIKFNDVIAAGGGGSRYHHASIYLGNGKIAEMIPTGAKISTIKESYKKKRMISIRISEDSKTGAKIAKEARNIVKQAPDYKADIDLVKDSLKKNIGFIKKDFTGMLTCTEFVDESVKGGTGNYLVNKFSVDPTDILNSKFKISSSYNFGKMSKKEKILNFVGKNFRNTKYYVLGAGIGASAALGFYAYNLYKEKNGGKVDRKNLKGSYSMFGKLGLIPNPDLKNGQWITYGGRRIFVKNKGKK